MARIDVSELLADPDFVDPVTLVHRKSEVLENGENSLTEVRVPTFGSVQPASGKQLQRVPDALKISDVRSFFIKAEILSDGAAQYPDIIIFRGQRYQVINTMPWLNWGAGWNEGLCVIEKAAV